MQGVYQIFSDFRRELNKQSSMNALSSPPTKEDDNNKIPAQTPTSGEQIKRRKGRTLTLDFFVTLWLSGWGVSSLLDWHFLTSVDRFSDSLFLNLLRNVLGTVKQKSSSFLVREQALWYSAISFDWGLYCACVRQISSLGLGFCSFFQSVVALLVLLGFVSGLWLHIPLACSLLSFVGDLCSSDILASLQSASRWS